MVNAGSDIIVQEQTTVEITGIASDDSGIAAILWEQLAGPPVDLNYSDTLVTNFIAPNISSSVSLEFRLSVEDAQGLSASDTIFVTINPLFEVQLEFPLNKTAFYGDNIEVTGRVDGFSGLLENVSVFVDAGGAEIEAEINSDGSWRARDVPIAPNDIGMTNLNIISFGPDEQSDSVQVELNGEVSFSSITNIVYSRADKKAYIYDYDNHSIFSVEKATGIRRVVSNNSTGTGPELNINDMVLDQTNGKNRILAISNGRDILSIDLTNGNRTNLTGNPLSSTPTLTNLDNISYHSDSNTIYLTAYYFENSRIFHNVLSVELETFSRSVISANRVGTGELLRQAHDMVLNESSNTLYIFDGERKAIVAIDIDAGGDRSDFSADGVGLGDTEFLNTFFGYMAYEETSSSIYTSFGNGHNHYKIDSSGNRSPVNSNIFSFKETRFVRGLTMGDNDSELLVLNDNPYALFSIDLATNESSIIQNEQLISNSSFYDISYINFSFDSILYSQDLTSVNSNKTQSIIGNDLMQYSLLSQTPEPVKSMFNGNNPVYFEDADNILYSLPFAYYNFQTLDISNGIEEYVSSIDKGEGVLFLNPVSHFTVDKANNIIYALDKIEFELFAIDPITGNRESIVEKDTIGIDFDYIYDMHYRSADGLIYILAQTGFIALYTINPNNGDLLLVHSFENDPDLTHTFNFVPAELKDEIYFSIIRGSVIGTSAIYKYHLAEQTITSVSDNLGTGNGPTLRHLYEIYLDPLEERIVTRDIDAILLVDIQSGDRVSLLR